MTKDIFIKKKIKKENLFSCSHSAFSLERKMKRIKKKNKMKICTKSSFSTSQVSECTHPTTKCQVQRKRKKKRRKNATHRSDRDNFVTKKCVCTQAIVVVDDDVVCWAGKLIK